MLPALLPCFSPLHLACDRADGRVPSRRRAVTLALLGSLALAPLATQAQTPPAGAEDVQARIGALQTQGKALRVEADTTFKRTEAECQQRFLVNDCIDKAKKQRLATINQARELEAEARKLDLAERQRQAAEINERAAARPAVPTVDATATPAAVGTPAARPDVPPDAAAEAEAARARAARDAERAAARQRTADEAAQRAEQAARDRARYDERIRKYEEEQAKKK